MFHVRSSYLLTRPSEENLQFGFENYILDHGTIQFVINGEYFGLFYSVSLDQHNCGNKIFSCVDYVVQNSIIYHARLEVPKLYIHLYAFRERGDRMWFC